MKKIIILVLVLLVLTGCGPTTKLTTSRTELCTDTDEGVDIFTKGVVTRGISQFEDTCINIEWVKEYYCIKENLGIQETKCPKGCTLGACN